MPQVFLIRLYLGDKDFTKALPLINHILKTVPFESVALAALSGTLGGNGYYEEVIDIILPHYNPEHYCFFEFIEYILRCFLELKKPKEGLDFIKKVRTDQKNVSEDSDFIRKMNELQLNEIVNPYEEKFIVSS
ncbi:MAG: hypothetical protein K2P93_08110 [Alphaproteobacteria bacterium]|nr:hypothetical protein [Alphaproteobacteria bacterium]